MVAVQFFRLYVRGKRRMTMISSRFFSFAICRRARFFDLDSRSVGGFLFYFLSVEVLDICGTL